MALINISGLSTNYQSTRKKIHVNCLCVWLQPDITVINLQVFYISDEICASKQSNECTWTSHHECRMQTKRKQKHWPRQLVAFSSHSPKFFRRNIHACDVNTNQHSKHLKKTQNSRERITTTRNKIMHKITVSTGSYLVQKQSDQSTQSNQSNRA